MDSPRTINHSEVEVKPLKDSFVITDFKCGKDQFDEYIKKTAHEDQRNNVGRVWLFYYNGKMIGYVTLAMSQLHKTEHSLLGNISSHGYIPGLLLGQMARHEDFKGRGIGDIMKDWVILQGVELSKKIGCRLIILQSDEDKVERYKEWSFVLIPASRRKKNMMFYDLTS